MFIKKTALTVSFVGLTLGAMPSLGIPLHAPSAGRMPAAHSAHPGRRYLTAGDETEISRERRKMLAVLVRHAKLLDNFPKYPDEHDTFKTDIATALSPKIEVKPEDLGVLASLERKSAWYGEGLMLVDKVGKRWIFVDREGRSFAVPTPPKMAVTDILFATVSRKTGGTLLVGYERDEKGIPTRVAYVDGKRYEAPTTRAVRHHGGDFTFGIPKFTGAEYAYVEKDAKMYLKTGDGSAELYLAFTGPSLEDHIDKGSRNRPSR